MNTEERNQKIELYGQGFEMLLAALKEIPLEVWKFKPEPREWSVHDKIRHQFLAPKEQLGVFFFKGVQSFVWAAPVKGLGLKIRFLLFEEKSYFLNGKAFVDGDITGGDVNFPAYTRNFSNFDIFIPVFA